jgi:predicted Zn-dependent protease
MGRDNDRQIQATMGLDPDTSLQRYIQQFGARLAARSERPTLPWTFRVVDDPVVNAFALPGGFIYITRGILAHLNSEAELAGVVGHEIGHVTARHSVTRLSEQQLAQVGIVVGAVVSPEFGQYADLANSALGVLFLKYSRDDEQQADHLGLRYMRRVGYDARQMPAVFEMLGRVSAASGGGRVPQWLATHPDPGDRRERITKEIAALPPESLGIQVERPGYLAHIDGLVFGTDPREGYFKGSRFLHPGLRFQFAFPDGWKTSNSRDAVAGTSPQNDAAIEVTGAPEHSADLAVRAFVAQRNVMAGSPSATTLNGLAARAVSFALTTNAGPLEGTLMCVEHDQQVYRLAGYAPQGRWPVYQTFIERSLASFAPLTDTATLNVQPFRVSIVKVERATTIAEVSQERASPLPPATLALINQIEVNTRLEPNTSIKWVVGRPPP